MILVNSMFNLVLQTKDFSANSLKQLMSNNETKFKNFFYQATNNKYVEQYIFVFGVSNFSRIYQFSSSRSQNPMLFKHNLLS